MTITPKANYSPIEQGGSRPGVALPASVRIVPVESSRQELGASVPRTLKQVGSSLVSPHKPVELGTHH